jgi:3-hydroxyacyl-[acyl-carrier-protein] dehydratase
MMLLNNFFTISQIEIKPSEIVAALEINKAHKIFDGHFPGQPVVPGVCMMQMVKEILENAIHQNTNLLKASEMKFLAIIDPAQNNHINASLKYTIAENGIILLAASLFKDELVHFKFKGMFDLQKHQ